MNESVAPQPIVEDLVDRLQRRRSGPTSPSKGVLTRRACVLIIGRKMPAATSGDSSRPLRPGDVVEVRPRAEILATLDASGSLDAMPFMPEMLRHVGRRFTVSRRVEKICDTIAATGSRRMRDTVYLEDLRCDGSGHGGCQAGCLIYWKEAWLRRVDFEGPEPSQRQREDGELDRRLRSKLMMGVGHGVFT